MKKFIGFVKGFGAAIWLVFAALTAIVGWFAGMYTSVGLDSCYRQKTNYRKDYSKINRD